MMIPIVEGVVLVKVETYLINMQSYACMCTYFSSSLQAQGGSIFSSYTMDTSAFIQCTSRVRVHIL